MWDFSLKHAHVFLTILILDCKVNWTYGQNIENYNTPPLRAATQDINILGLRINKWPTRVSDKITLKWVFINAQ